MDVADDGRTLIDLSENGWHALLEAPSSIGVTQNDAETDDKTASMTRQKDEEARTDGVDRPAVQSGLGWSKRINNE